ncbi:MAG: hypothetical protein HY719_01285 [Planctomycetes bacterium]|nr:hypothetical protein [Planctomycetota bacterium]
MLRLTHCTLVSGLFVIAVYLATGCACDHQGKDPSPTGASAPNASDPQVEQATGAGPVHVGEGSIEAEGSTVESRPAHESTGAQVEGEGYKYEAGSGCISLDLFADYCMTYPHLSELEAKDWFSGEIRQGHDFLWRTYAMGTRSAEGDSDSPLPPWYTWPIYHGISGADFESYDGVTPLPNWKSRFGRVPAAGLFVVFSGDLSPSEGDYNVVGLGGHPAYTPDEVAVMVDVIKQHGYRGLSFARPPFKTLADRVSCMPRVSTDYWRCFLYDDLRPYLVQRHSVWTFADEMLYQESRAYTVCKRVRDEHLEMLSLHPDIEMLGLSGCDLVTEKGLRHLARLPNLHHLWIDRVPLSVEAVRAISAISSLVSLSMDECALPSECLPELARLTNLEQLSLSSNTLKNGDFSFLSSLSKLQQLYLDDTSFADRDVHHLSKLSALDYLNLSWTSVTDAGVSTLPLLPKLRSLLLDDTRVTGDGFRGATSTPDLYRLSFRGAAVTDESIPYLSRSHFKSLSELDLSNCGVGKTRLSADVLAAPGWSSLNLSGTDVSDPFVIHFANKAHNASHLSPTALDLYLGGCSVTDKGALALARCESPRKVVLASTQVSDTGFLALAEASNIEHVAVAGSRVRPQTALAHSRKLPLYEQYYFQQVAAKNEQHSEK